MRMICDRCWERNCQCSPAEQETDRQKVIADYAASMGLPRGWQPGEPVAWRVLITKNGKTYHEYTERLPFEPDEDSGVWVRSEPEPLYSIEEFRKDGEQVRTEEKAGPSGADRPSGD